MDASLTHGESSARALAPLLDTLVEQYGYDFRQYASSCLTRRLTQACRQFGCHTFAELRDRLLQDRSILPQVIRYVTVQVSEMFRDPTFFLALREHVLPHLLTYPSVRVWVAGCSAGEELYSLAILFREEGLENRTQFYATDINTAALEKAESGIYPLDRLALFSRNYQLAGGRSSLSEYFTAGYNAAVFDRTLRQRTVFADHSLVSDSVFAEVQLVLCRNVLIYFERPLQERALALFREALVRRGFLGLGHRESLRFLAGAAHFSEFLPQERIYQKRGDR